MILKEIEIFDFKSIKHETLFLNSHQICLVGINECGKTSFLEAISYLNVLDKEMRKGLLNKGAKNYPNGFPLISGVFHLTEEESQKIEEIVSETQDKIDLPTQFDATHLQLKRWGNGFNNISIVLETKNGALDLLAALTKKADFLDKFFNSIYPIVEFYEDEELLIEPATIDELLSDDKRFETFRRLLFIGGCKNLELLKEDEGDARITFLYDISENLNQILKKHYRQDSSIQILISPHFGNKLVLIIRDSSNKSFSINERSPGFQYYFAFLINKIYLNQVHEDRSLIYLLDEPGYNLHPKGAKDLVDTFLEVSQKNQILFTTHNPFLTIRNDIDSLIYVYKDSRIGTKLNRKPFLNKYQVLRKELGILLNDSFILGDFNLIVEGNTEKFALHRLFNEEEFIDLQWLNIYNADGVTNVSQALNYLGKNNLGLSGVVLLDSDLEARKETEKKGFINALKEKWGFTEINNVFKNDNKERTFEDLFPQSLYVTAFNKYCHSLKDVGVFDQEYVDFEMSQTLPTPIIKHLENHFFKFINEGRRKENSITKQDVIRILLNDIDGLQEDQKIVALENISKLIKLLREKIKHVSHKTQSF